jgi:transposase
MPIEGATLPDDPEALRALIAAQAAELLAARAGLVAKALEIETLKLQIARLRRQSFGRSSEKLGQVIGQLELSLEELEADQAAAGERPDEPAAAPAAAAATSEVKRRRGRRPLPEHLPRTDVVHAPSCVCPACGGAMRKVGEDVTETLDYIPGRFEVIRHVRPAFSCRRCETMAQAPMPSLPIDRGRPGPGLLAHVLVSKYCDHLPLYRQAQIYGREGVDLDRARMADWVGKAAGLLRPLVEAIASHVMAADKLHADDTPVPVLAAAPKPAGCGSTCATTGRAPDRLRRRCSTATARTARASIRGRTSAPSMACCRPTVMPGSTTSTRRRAAACPRSSRSRAGRTFGASSTTSIRPPVR